jgi:hypothetical protein
MRSRPDYVVNTNTLHKFWIYENTRAYSVRLVNGVDRKQFQYIVISILNNKLASDVATDKIFEGRNIFKDYLQFFSDKERFMKNILFIRVQEKISKIISLNINFLKYHKWIKCYFLIQRFSIFMVFAEFFNNIVVTH